MTRIFQSLRCPPRPHRRILGSGHGRSRGPSHLEKLVRAPRPRPGVAPASYLSPSSPGERRGVTRGQTRSPLRLRSDRSARSPRLGETREFVFWWFPFPSDMKGVRGLAGAGQTSGPAEPSPLRALLSPSPGCRFYTVPSPTADPHLAVLFPHLFFPPPPNKSKKGRTPAGARAGGKATRARSSRSHFREGAAPT